MKVIKHIKDGNLIYVSHIDTMRVLQRTLVRAKINVKMSEGFNPHPITYTSHPLPLGVASEEEYFVVANDDLTAEQVLKAFNENVPSGMKALQCYDCDKNPNFAKNVNYCEYFVKNDQVINFKEQIEELANLSSWIINFPYKDTIKEQEIAPLIKSLQVFEDGLKMVIATGNPNLRPDRLCDEINKKFATKINATDIVRTKQLIVNEDKITTCEEFLKGFIK